MVAEILSFPGEKLSRSELAWHEAGHAVLAALLGQPIEWVMINELSGYGEVEPRTSPFLRLVEPFESRRRFLIAMAGSVVQCLATGEDCRWMPGSDGDQRRAEDYAELAGFPLDNFSMVRAILSQPEVWERVDRLAAALLQRDQLLAWDGLDEFLPEGDRGVCEMVGISPAGAGSG
jgi:hypothetical protein